VPLTEEVEERADWTALEQWDLCICFKITSIRIRTETIEEGDGGVNTP
jgi:hypothetical protein